VIVMVVNTAVTGESLRGSLCIGSPDEVEPCRPQPVPDMTFVAGDDGPGTSPGGCAIGPSRRGPVSALGLLLVLLALAQRRRR
jgi:hypothetical protein